MKTHRSKRLSLRPVTEKDVLELKPGEFADVADDAIAKVVETVERRSCTFWQFEYDGGHWSVRRVA